MYGLEAIPFASPESTSKTKGGGHIKFEHFWHQLTMGEVMHVSFSYIQMTFTMASTIYVQCYLLYR
jgi:hypothetical protein